MKCPYCQTYNTIHKGKRVHQRYKCNECKKWFFEKTGSFYYRARFPPFVLFFAMMLCIVLRASLVCLFVKIIFRCYISPKSIKKWTRKFLDTLPNVYHPVKKSDSIFLICHADEKFIKINGKQSYLWSVVDSAGNWVTSLITLERDKESAKKLYKQLKEIYKKVDIIVTDGLQSYKGLESIFGLSCRHIIAHMTGKNVMYKNHLLFLTNNQAENLNSHIEMYLSRFRYHFTNLESAQAYIKGFMFITQLLNSFQLQHTLQQSSMPVIWEKSIEEVSILLDK